MSIVHLSREIVSSVVLAALRVTAVSLGSTESLMTFSTSCGLAATLLKMYGVFFGRKPIPTAMTFLLPYVFLQYPIGTPTVNHLRFLFIHLCPENSFKGILDKQTLHVSWVHWCLTFSPRDMPLRILSISRIRSSANVSCALLV